MLLWAAVAVVLPALVVAVVWHWSVAHRVIVQPAGVLPPAPLSATFANRKLILPRQSLMMALALVLALVLVTILGLAVLGLAVVGLVVLFVALQASTYDK